MDNLTHSLIGLAASKAGLERLSPGTTTLCVLAANAPDADIVALIGGRWSYLHHHRGVTHSIIGMLALSVALPVVFYLIDWLLSRFRNRQRSIRLPGLLLASLLASATHPLMDLTNNYGVRFLLPWSPRWFYGDLVFILDPFLWVILGGSTFLLTATTKARTAVWLTIAAATSFVILFGPASRGGLPNPTPLRIFWICAVVGLLVIHLQGTARRWGAKVSMVALASVGVYLAALFVVHGIAVRQASLQASYIANENQEQTIRIAAMPTLANPARWMSVFETDRATYRFSLDLWSGSVSDKVRFAKPEASSASAVKQAGKDSRAQVFLDFARFPVVNVAGDDCLTQTLVQFADLRYTEPGRGRGTFSLEVPVDCPVQKSEHDE